MAWNLSINVGRNLHYIGPWKQNLKQAKLLNKLLIFKSQNSADSTRTLSRVRSFNSFCICTAKTRHAKTYLVRRNQISSFSAHTNIYSLRTEDMTEREASDALENLCEEDIQKLHTVKLEFDFLKSSGAPIPEKMSEVDWIDLMLIESSSNRAGFLKFLAHKAKLKRNEKDAQIIEDSALTVEKPDLYPHGKILNYYTDRDLKRLQTHKLANAMQWGLPLVIDMDYVDFMSNKRLIQNTAEQLVYAYSANRKEQHPFHFVFTRCEENNRTFGFFNKILSDERDILVTRTDKSYADYFDRDELIYLSPHATEVMESFDPHSVYIVGGFNDKYANKQISNNRAQEKEIRCQKLPLDEHVQWKQGGKVLTITGVIRILLTIKRTGSWDEAFKCLPQRHFKSDEDQLLERFKRFDKIL